MTNWRERFKSQMRITFDTKVKTALKTGKNVMQFLAIPVQPGGQQGLFLNLRYTPQAACSEPLTLPFVCHDQELSVALTSDSDTTKQCKVKNNSIVNHSQDREGEQRESNWQDYCSFVC